LHLVLENKSSAGFYRHALFFDGEISIVLAAMDDRRYVPLSVRILAVAALNAVVLGAGFVIFLRAQLKPEFESFLLAGARGRIASVTTAITLDLVNARASQWDDVLQRYSNKYGVQFLLFRNTGEQLAGPPTRLPAEADARLPRRGPPPLAPAHAPFPPPVLSRDALPHLGAPPGPVGPPFLVLTRSKPKYWIGVRMPLIEGPGSEPLRSVLFLATPSFFTNPFFFEVKPWLGIAATAAAICALCWLPLVRGLTTSIGEMVQVTERIAEGHFDAIAGAAPRRDELGRLGVSINRMAARLKTLTDGRKRFLADVAHELRSPLARMQLAAELLERKVNADARPRIQDLKEDILLLSQLTDELLQFTRADMGAESLQLVDVNVAEAVGIAVRREFVDGVDIRVEADPALRVSAHPEFLIRSLCNVLRNAVRYAGTCGPIHVSGSRSGDQIHICVADSGPGVPEDSLDKIFTPFYRVDDARDRRTGGAGLGLAIVRTCIEACGGAVDCRNRKPSGFEVLIRMRAA